MLTRWNNLSLVQKFLLAGGTVMLLSTIIVGTWVSSRIEQSVVDNTAAATALYMESFISPLSQDLAEGDTLPPPARQAMVEVFSGTELGRRVLSFRILKKGGLVAYSTDESLIGKEFSSNPAVETAWGGSVSAVLHDRDSGTGAKYGTALLQIYSPIREVWSGKVIAVAEIYEIADFLKADLQEARRTSWMVVATVFLACAALLFSIVRAGSRTIIKQQSELRARMEASRDLAHQNQALRARAVSASARAAAQAERGLRQLGADLHDGPGQHLALVALRLEKLVPDTDTGRAEAKTISDALQNAMHEIRTISRGLSLPELENLSFEDIVLRAIEDHGRRSPISATHDYHGPSDPTVDQSAKICAYRFLQEGLANSARHAGGSAAHVVVEVDETGLKITLTDQGVGFEPEMIALRQDGGQGLVGLRDRIESIGGSFEVETAPGEGTILRLYLPLDGAA